MRRLIVRTVAATGVALVAACKGGDGPTPPPGGTATKIVEVNPASYSAKANTILANTIVVAVQDTNSVGLANQIVTFEVLNGGGALIGQVIDTTGADGKVTAPQWRLGKSASPQTLRAISGALNPLDINATVQTTYNIVVRFFNASQMTPAQQALFTNAAQRIMGIVTLDVADVQLTAQNITNCDASLTDPLTEVVDDVVIYATISNIDGNSGVLASAGPCFVRSGAANNKIPLLGVMKFDSSDLATITGNGSFQEVITHEMLHVLGLGALWGSCSSCFNFINGSGTADPQYNQPGAKAACLDVGGTASCLNGVPVENTGGAGTRESHWRDVNFDNELMTGTINVSPNPLSAVTIASLADMGYTVNTADNDTYTMAALMANLGAPNFGMAPQMPPNWEKLDGVPLYSIDEKGTVKLVRRAR